MRLNQFLASAGLGSRRACERLIIEGRVSIDNQVVKQLATRVTESSKVTVDGRHIKTQHNLSVLLYKPKGVICSTVDSEARDTVFDLLPAEFPRLFYVGRLDVDSEGLLILTNNGALAQRLTHPRYKLPKTYQVHLDKPFDLALGPKLLKGFPIEPGYAKMDEIHKTGDYVVKVVLTQGLKRQIRHMFYRVGYEVKKLVRVKIGELRLGNLKPGQWRQLSDRDMQLLNAPDRPKPTSRHEKSSQNRKRQKIRPNLGR